jgi:transposase
MARYKHHDYGQSKLIPVHFDRQVLPGTFEYTLSYLIEHECDLSWFEARYRNDEGGAPAYDPAILLKVILFAYSRGITSSRAIARACEENVVFMALSGDSRPHFTTIAAFIANMGEGAARLFRDVLLVCDEQGLIGREMFAVDGVKMPSNASKEWSGTRDDFQRKAKKMEAAVQALVGRHRRDDERKQTRGDDDGSDGGLSERERRTLDTLEGKLAKVRAWLAEGEDKLGRSGKPVKSNLTDNDSAKMASSHGVIQGYLGVTVVDSAHQIIVNAQAFGEAQEHALLRPMLEGVREQLPGRRGSDVLREASVSADSGYHTNDNVRWLADEGIDGYLADNRMRKRDPLFANAADHDPGKPMWGVDKTPKKPRLYARNEFRYDEALGRCWCPAGKELRLSHRGRQGEYEEAVSFRGTQDTCGQCDQRARCLRHPQRTPARQVTFFGARLHSRTQDAVAKMREKVDSAAGKLKYALRLATAEPPFANICQTMGLKRFTLRGRHKVNPQWQMFTLVHNIGKLARYGYADG